jgi:hypothetical protein
MQIALEAYRGTNPHGSSSRSRSSVNSNRWTPTPIRSFLVLALLAVGLLNCDLGPELGAARVQVGASEVFFIREVRGHNYDSLVISRSSNLCQPLGAPNNYVFSELGPLHPYYRVVGGTLHLYVTSPATPPSTPFPIAVIQHVLTPLEYVKLEDAAQQTGLERIDVPVHRKHC